MPSFFQSGFPVAVFQNQNCNSVFGNGLTRQSLQGLPLISGCLPDRLDNCLNPFAFNTTPQFTFSNVARTVDYRGSGGINWDLTQLKTFAVLERFKRQLRAEVSHDLDKPQFNIPNTAFGSATSAPTKRSSRSRSGSACAFRFS